MSSSPRVMRGGSGDRRRSEFKGEVYRNQHAVADAFVTYRSCGLRLILGAPLACPCCAPFSPYTAIHSLRNRTRSRPSVPLYLCISS
jgi:hypothetical protein